MKNEKINKNTNIVTLSERRFLKRSDDNTISENINNNGVIYENKYTINSMKNNFSKYVKLYYLFILIYLIYLH